MLQGAGAWALASPLLAGAAVAAAQELPAIPALTAMGYNNVLWGSDFPHIDADVNANAVILFLTVQGELTDRALPRPDTYYGVAKVAAPTQLIGGPNPGTYVRRHVSTARTNRRMSACVL